MKVPLEDEHGFHSPEEAAFHAVCVQGGFSTPEREAARMLLDGGISEQRAKAWMYRQGLSEEDLQWDPGRLADYQGRKRWGVFVRVPEAGPEWREWHRWTGNDLDVLPDKAAAEERARQVRDRHPDWDAEADQTTAPLPGPFTSEFAAYLPQTGDHDDHQ